MKRLRLRSGSFDSIFPSHGKEMLSRSIINDEIALSERVLHGEKSSDDTSFNDGRILYKDKNVEILR